MSGIANEGGEVVVGGRRLDHHHLRNIFRKLNITSRRQLRGIKLDDPATAPKVHSVSPLSVPKPP